MRVRQAGAVAICVGIVAAAYLAWHATIGGFNPNPGTATLDTTSCTPSLPPCPAFGVDSANLTVIQQTDHTSQWLSVKVSATGASVVASLRVYFASHLMGDLTVNLSPGHSSTSSWPIPTTVNVTRGDSYSVQIRATYGQAGSSAVFWRTVNVTAS